jgi:hypothetical protein
MLLLVTPRMCGELLSDEFYAQRPKTYPPTTIDVIHTFKDD